MKTKYPSILGVFAAILMVASFVVPMNIAAPSPVSADPGIMKWDTVPTPYSKPGQNDVLNYHNCGAIDGFGNEIIDMAVGNDGMTVAFIDRLWLDPGMAGAISLGALKPWNVWAGATGRYVNTLLYSNTTGISTTITRWIALVRSASFPTGADLFQVAIAPDDAKFIAVTSDGGLGVAGGIAAMKTGPKVIWVTTDAGQNWDLAFDGTQPGTLAATETIRDFDISMDYGGKRDIGFVTVNSDGVTAGRWFCRPSTGFSTWVKQIDPIGVIPLGWAYFAIKFSPTYNGDSSVALVYANLTATYFNVALRDINANITNNYAWGEYDVEVKNPVSIATASPGATELKNVSLQLPSDF